MADVSLASSKSFIASPPSQMNRPVGGRRRSYAPSSYSSLLCSVSSCFSSSSSSSFSVLLFVLFLLTALLPSLLCLPSPPLTASEAVGVSVDALDPSSPQRSATSTSASLPSPLPSSPPPSLVVPPSVISDGEGGRVSLADSDPAVSEGLSSRPPRSSSMESSLCSSSSPPSSDSLTPSEVPSLPLAQLMARKAEQNGQLREVLPVDTSPLPSVVGDYREQAELFEQSTEGEENPLSRSHSSAASILPSPVHFTGPPSPLPVPLQSSFHRGSPPLSLPPPICRAEDALTSEGEGRDLQMGRGVVGAAREELLPPSTPSTVLPPHQSRAAAADASPSSDSSSPSPLMEGLSPPSPPSSASSKRTSIAELNELKDTVLKKLEEKKKEKEKEKLKEITQHQQHQQQQQQQQPHLSLSPAEEAASFASAADVVGGGGGSAVIHTPSSPSSSLLPSSSSSPAVSVSSAAAAAAIVGGPSLSGRSAVPTVIYPSNPSSSPSDRFNYAAYDSGAKLLASSPNMKKASSILIADDDRYLMVPCVEAEKWFIVQLKEDILLESLEIANFEHYASSISDFTLYGSSVYPSEQWSELGHFHAPLSHHPHLFSLPTRDYAVRYLKLRWDTWWKDEYYCTLTHFKVYGRSVLEAFREDLDDSAEVLREVEQVLIQQAVKDTVDSHKEEEGLVELPQAMKGTSPALVTGVEELSTPPSQVHQVLDPGVSAPSLSLHSAPSSLTEDLTSTASDEAFASASPTSSVASSQGSSPPSLPLSSSWSSSSTAFAPFPPPSPPRSSLVESSFPSTASLNWTNFPLSDVSSARDDSSASVPEAVAAEEEKWATTRLARPSNGSHGMTDSVHSFAAPLIASIPSHSEDVELPGVLTEVAVEASSIAGSSSSTFRTPSSAPPPPSPPSSPSVPSSFLTARDLIYSQMAKLGRQAGAASQAEAEAAASQIDPSYAARLFARYTQGTTSTTTQQHDTIAANQHNTATPTITVIDTTATSASQLLTDADKGGETGDGGMRVHLAQGTEDAGSTLLRTTTTGDSANEATVVSSAGTGGSGSAGSRGGGGGGGVSSASGGAVAVSGHQSIFKTLTNRLKELEIHQALSTHFVSALSDRFAEDIDRLNAHLLTLTQHIHNLGGRTLPRKEGKDEEVPSSPLLEDVRAFKERESAIRSSVLEEVRAEMKGELQGLQDTQRQLQQRMMENLHATAALHLLMHQEMMALMALLVVSKAVTSLAPSVSMLVSRAMVRMGHLSVVCGDVLSGTAPPPCRVVLLSPPHRPRPLPSAGKALSRHRRAISADGAGALRTAPSNPYANGRGLSGRKKGEVVPHLSSPLKTSATAAALTSSAPPPVSSPPSPLEPARPGEFRLSPSWPPSDVGERPKRSSVPQSSPSESSPALPPSPLSASPQVFTAVPPPHPPPSSSSSSPPPLSSSPPPRRCSPPSGHRPRSFSGHSLPSPRASDPLFSPPPSTSPSTESPPFPDERKEGCFESFHSPPTLPLRVSFPFPPLPPSLPLWSPALPIRPPSPPSVVVWGGRKALEHRSARPPLHTSRNAFAVLRSPEPKRGKGGSPQVT